MTGTLNPLRGIMNLRDARADAERHERRHAWEDSAKTARRRNHTAITPGTLLTTMLVADAKHLTKHCAGSHTMTFCKARADQHGTLTRKPNCFSRNPTFAFSSAMEGCMFCPGSGTKQA